MKVVIHRRYDGFYVHDGDGTVLIAEEVYVDGRAVTLRVDGKLIVDAIEVRAEDKKVEITTLEKLLWGLLGELIRAL